MEDRMRVGKFTINGGMIKRSPKAVLAVLNGCIVTRAEGLWHADKIEYIALGEHFDEVAAGDVCPEYEPVVKDLVGGKYHVTWLRKDMMPADGTR